MREDRQWCLRKSQSEFFNLYPHFRPEWGFGEAVKWMDRLIRSENYALFIASAPLTGSDQLASGDSVEHDTVVFPGTLLWGLTSSTGVSTGFRFAIWNDDRLVVPRMNSQNLAGLSAGAAPNTTAAAMPYLLTPPYTVQGSGLLHIKITNLATATNGVQLVMFFAVPRK